MTGQQFLNFLCSKSGQIGLLDKNVNDSSYRAFMLDCLNLVVKDIQNRQVNWHWRFLEKTATAPTVAAQMDYDLPTDIDTNKLFALYDRTQDRTYKYIPYELFIRLVADPSNNSGDTVWWTFWGKVIKLFPIPSSVITFYLDYVQLITALTDAATSCEIPAKYDPVVIDGALVWAYKFDPEAGLWTAQQKAYEAGIKKMIDDNNSIINDGGETESHRVKMTQAQDAKHLFPINS